MTITERTPATEFAEHLRERPDGGLPDGWWNWANAIKAHRLLAERFVESLSEYPEGRYAGRGVVICGGGHRLFTNAWVCLRMLRHLGCRLPIELWHLDNEVDGGMAEFVRSWDVGCVNAEDIRGELARPPRILHGWELKPFAILHSRFREILFLDADNIPVTDPEFLFLTSEYGATGAIFWPDFGRMEESRGMWSATGVPYRDEPEFESGQIVVDKSRTWRALNLTMHYNEHSDFYYKHVHGDKCTFRFGWHGTGTPFSMPSYGILAIDATMCQHDFQGRRIFQHRNMDKWRLDGRNREISDFWYESICREFLADLRGRWSGNPFRNPPADEDERTLFEAVADRLFRYERVGYDWRPIELRRDGTVGEGAAACERFWSINRLGGALVLTLLGENEPTCHLRFDGRTWTGRWLRHERMPVSLMEVRSNTDEPTVIASAWIPK